MADGGTLFLDEIGETGAAAAGQAAARFGRWLDATCRIGQGAAQSTCGSWPPRIATWPRTWPKGHFREDLYYRINVMSLLLPPLRERQGDIPLLVNKFLGPGWSIDDDALAALTQHRWPGNVRQLINAIDRAKIMAEDARIRLADLPPDIGRTSHSGQPKHRPPAPTTTIWPRSSVRTSSRSWSANGGTRRGPRGRWG